MPSALSRFRRWDESLASWFDRFFEPQCNPWRYLGALAFWCFAICIASGIIAYALYDTSVQGAYESGRRLESGYFYLGRVLRGLHRYSADGFLFLSVVHLAREWARGHYRGVRWFPWISGIPLLWLVWLAGITGFWLLWDSLALFSVTATAQWVQALPGFSDLLTRNFLTPQALTDRFFSLIVFIHIGVPLLLLAGVWIHIQRIANVRLWPPRKLAVGTLLAMTAASLLLPVKSLEPASAGGIPATVSIDWFYMAIHPLVDVTSELGVWAGLVVVFAVLLLLPWLPQTTASAPRAAYVDLANCNGCGRCAVDCPFGAVVMVPRTDTLHHRQQASVLSDMCAACGICVGACPSSTPFRRIEDIVSGIELPDLPVGQLRKQLQANLKQTPDVQSQIVVFSCMQATVQAPASDTQRAVIPLACAGMLPPSFVDYALRQGAEGVVIAGCRSCDCEFRLGDKWLQERLQGTREPKLRAAVPREKIEVVWAGEDREMVERAIVRLRQRLKGTPIVPSAARSEL